MAVYKVYCRRYQRLLLQSIKKIQALEKTDVVLLTSKKFIPESLNIHGVRVLYFDVLANRVAFNNLSLENNRFLKEWHLINGQKDPRWYFNQVYLPDIMEVGLGIILHMEITWYIGIIRELFNEIRPRVVYLATGQSYSERLAITHAQQHNLPYKRLGFTFISFFIPRLWSWLLTRAWRRRWEYLIDHPRKESVSTGPVDFMFVACRGRQALVFKPLIDAIIAKTSMRVSVLASAENDPLLELEMKKMKADRIDASFCMDYLPKEDLKDLINQWRPTVHRLWKELRSGSSARSQRYHEGVDLFGLSESMLKMATIHGTFFALLYTEAVRRMLIKSAPKQIVVSSDRRYPERAAVYLGKIMNIPTRFYLTNTILSRDLTNKYDIADRVMVVGPLMKKNLKQKGLPENTISIVGDARFDLLVSSDKRELRRKIAMELGLSETKPWVTVVSKYASQNFTNEEKENTYSILREAFEKLPSYQWIVKVHPNENLEQLKNQLKLWGCRPSAVIQNIDICSLFYVSDLAVMVTSMAGLEAMVLKVPVIAVQPDKRFDESNIIPYVSSGAACLVRNAGELTQNMVHLLESNNDREQLLQRASQFAAQYILPPDGQTLDRILTGTTR